MFHLKSNIFRMSQTGAGFVIDKSQIFKMGTRTLGNERLGESPANT